MLKYKTNKSLAEPQDCVLLVVDVQDRLIDSISKADTVITNIAALIKTAQTFQIPVLTTEQEKLGSTVLQLKELLQHCDTCHSITKCYFSSWRSTAFREVLENINRRRLLITGLEAHICVSQTALDLLANDYLVHIVADATSSHSLEDHKMTLDRLSSQGAILTTTEALIYELTSTAQTPGFKKILEVVKDRRNSLAMLATTHGAR